MSGSGGSVAERGLSSRSTEENPRVGVEVERKEENGKKGTSSEPKMFQCLTTLQACEMDSGTVAGTLRTDPARGLTSLEASVRRDVFG